MTFTLNIKTASDIQNEQLMIIKKKFTKEIDNHIESIAHSLEYNSAAHLASYVSSSVPFWAAEADAFIKWRDSCWVVALGILDATIQTGQIPDIEDVIAALPEWEHPSL